MDADWLGSPSSDAPTTPRVQTDTALIHRPNGHGQVSLCWQLGFKRARKLLFERGYLRFVFFSWLGRATLGRARNFSYTKVWTAW